MSGFEQAPRPKKEEEKVDTSWVDLTEGKFDKTPPLAASPEIETPQATETPGASKTAEAESELHDEHVKARVEEDKRIFQEHLELAKERLSQLSSADSVLSSSTGKGSKFTSFFHSLVIRPIGLSDEQRLASSTEEKGRVIQSNLNEIRELAKQGLEIYYQALKANPPKENELGQMAYGAREIANYLAAPRAFKNYDKPEFIPFLPEEDYKKLNQLGDFGGHQSPQKDRERYLEARKIISEL